MGDVEVCDDCGHARGDHLRGNGPCLCSYYHRLDGGDRVIVEPCACDRFVEAVPMPF